jgi:hypothetical protein
VHDSVDYLNVTNLLHLHPTTNLLEEYAMNRLPECQIASLEEHLLLCQPCCEALTAVEQDIMLMHLIAGN